MERNSAVQTQTMPVLAMLQDIKGSHSLPGEAGWATPRKGGQNEIPERQ
jgi:hypothetical protein